MNKSKKILIVEDDEVFFTAIKDGLVEEGFSVARADDGEKGFIMAQEEKPDLIFMDIMLPKMDGITAAKKIKEAGITVPIVFLTNLGDIDHISKAVETAQSDYLVKSEMSIEDIVNMAKKKLSLK